MTVTYSVRFQTLHKDCLLHFSEQKIIKALKLFDKNALIVMFFVVAFHQICMLFVLPGEIQGGGLSKVESNHPSAAAVES